ncbi:hypothetical protein GW17_00056049 [Ensete ventricosum]|nr:hypothetical protein GW17_00056049 [Ensete ventricosum]RZS23675.1 hypothetical protein BHM03_00056646 [Ensete ventricosum]
MPDRGDSLQTVDLDQMLPRVDSSIHAHLYFGHWGRKQLGGVPRSGPGNVFRFI